MRVAMVTYGDIPTDSRVQREASSLADAGHDVTLFCLAGSRHEAPLLDPRVRLVVRPAAPGAIAPGSPNPYLSGGTTSHGPAITRRVAWLAAYVRTLRRWGRAITSEASGIDVWHMHDFTALVAVSGFLDPRVRRVYDMHDLFVDTGTASFLPGLARQVIRRYERHLVRRVDLAVTVNGPVADVMRRRLRPRDLIVVHNCPPRWVPPEPPPDLIRAATGIPRDAPIVLYHGLLSADRGIERLFDAILRPELAGVHLALMGFGPSRASLSRLATEARFHGRVHVLEPVPTAELLPWVASADVGVAAMPRATLNLYLSTPNKLFECLAAGTPVVVSDFPAVRGIVWDDPLGPLGDTCRPSDTDDLARALAGIVRLDPAARRDLRARCNRAAHERWNWETEAAGLVAAYARLSDPPRNRGSRAS